MNKIRQILAFVRSLLDFLLNLGSHTPQKQPPHDTTDTPTEPTPPFPPLPPARLGQPLPAGGTLPPARHAGGSAGGYRGDTLALVHPSPGPLNLLGWGPHASFCFLGSHCIDEKGNLLSTDFDRWTSKQLRRPHNIGIFDGEDYIKHNLYWRNYIYNASGVVFRKQCFEQIKDLSCFSMRYSGDWLFWIEMARQGSVVELYEKLNLFRLHSTSTTVEGNASGNAILEDIQVVHYVESFSYPIGRYKRLMRHGMLYKNIKRAKVDPKMRLLLFEKLKGCFGTSMWTYRWERVNKYMSFLNPWQPTRDRDRL